jgi:hypothetical protein
MQGKCHMLTCHYFDLLFVLYKGVMMDFFPKHVTKANASRYKMCFVRWIIRFPSLTSRRLIRSVKSWLLPRARRNLRKSLRTTATYRRLYTQRLLRDAWDRHNIVYQEYCLLECYSRRNLTLKLEATGFEGTSLHLYQTALCHVPGRRYL